MMKFLTAFFMIFLIHTSFYASEISPESLEQACDRYSEIIVGEIESSLFLGEKKSLLFKGSSEKLKHTELNIKVVHTLKGKVGKKVKYILTGVLTEEYNKGDKFIFFSNSIAGKVYIGNIISNRDKISYNKWVFNPNGIKEFPCTFDDCISKIKNYKTQIKKDMFISTFIKSVKEQDFKSLKPIVASLSAKDKKSILELSKSMDKEINVTWTAKGESEIADFQIGKDLKVSLKVTTENNKYKILINSTP